MKRIAVIFVLSKHFLKKRCGFRLLVDLDQRVCKMIFGGHVGGIELQRGAQFRNSIRIIALAN